MSGTEQLLKTPLHAWHAAHGGRMVEFGGWSMPVQYTSIIDEHQVVRNRLGLFDISHMGRLRFDGPDAADWLESLTTNAVARLAPGQIQYSLLCLDNGGIFDDILVYRLTDTDAYGVVCNASNRDRVVAHFLANQDGRTATLADSTLETAMIAVQGPRALITVQQVFDGPLGTLKYYHHASGTALGTPASVSRTGYTGEDGFELIVHQDVAEAVWTNLLEAGLVSGCQPCGLGARDTLRFEAAMPLYGHELSEEVDPFSAGLGMFVKLDKGDFLGRDALQARKANPPHARVGLALPGKRIARQGCPLVQGTQQVGTVTSGTFAPTLQRSLAMALVQTPAPAIGETIGVDIRGQVESAEIVALPFYKRPKA